MPIKELEYRGPEVYEQPAPQKLGVIQTTSPLMADYRSSTIWYAIMERSYGEAIEKLKAIVRDDFKMGISGAAQVVELFPCIIDLNQARTHREGEQVRRAYRKIATIIAGFVNRLVKYEPAARPDAFDFVRHELMMSRPLWSPFQCSTFAKETDPAAPKKRGGGGINDWGKTKPYWCTACGFGFGSPEKVRAHYERTGHGNEATQIGAKQLTSEQQDLAWRERNK